MRRARSLLGLVVGALAVVACACGAAASFAAPATWSGSEQPVPPGSSWPVGLGKVGDVEFQAPNRGLLITEGEAPTIPPGVWAYNGAGWHELSSVCGASDGRIAWASPSEFWTVSNGRAGQANEITGDGGEVEVPIEDNSLCHFAGGQLVASYAHPADETDSYQAMHAAACLTATDCWFGGDPLASPQIGGFHLHWNGSALENAPYIGEGHAIEDMKTLENHIYESVRFSRSDRVSGEAGLPALHRINPEGVSPAVEPEEGLFGEGLPLYGFEEAPAALEALHLSATSSALWAAAGPSSEAPNGQVTVARAVKREWTQLIGPEHPLEAILPEPAEETALLTTSAARASVSAIAAEPGTGEAWLALAPPVGVSSRDQRAVLVHLSPEGTVLGEQTLPSAAEEEAGIGPQGAGAKLTCPAAGDCWLATTRGWLFHLAPEGERTLGRDPRESEYFTGLITFRPPDQGLPQVIGDAPPPDTSGLIEEGPNYGESIEEHKSEPEAKVTLPLLSHVHSRLLHGSTLELRFHLAVKARLRLIAMRKRRIVASTPRRTLGAGNRKLTLRLNPKRWPTRLKLEEHPLAPLPVVSSVTGPGAGIGTETTSLRVLARSPFEDKPSLLR